VRVALSCVSRSHVRGVGASHSTTEGTEEDKEEGAPSSSVSSSVVDGPGFAWNIYVKLSSRRGGCTCRRVSGNSAHAASTGTRTAVFFSGSAPRDRGSGRWWDTDAIAPMRWGPMGGSHRGGVPDGIPPARAPSVDLPKGLIGVDLPTSSILIHTRRRPCGERKATGGPRRT